ncbi:MAG: hypothetical protein HKN25_11240 [Pyrinomonadaceae bacterium]|nr:hypothetical protein [Pyrinomonadaceae bacterium]
MTISIASGDRLEHKRVTVGDKSNSVGRIPMDTKTQGSDAESVELQSDSFKL